VFFWTDRAFKVRRYARSDLPSPVLAYLACSGESDQLDGDERFLLVELSGLGFEGGAMREELERTIEGDDSPSATGGLGACFFWQRQVESPANEPELRDGDYCRRLPQDSPGRCTAPGSSSGVLHRRKRRDKQSNSPVASRMRVVAVSTAPAVVAGVVVSPDTAVISMESLIPQESRKALVDFERGCGWRRGG
jgi:hypothetical protein